MSNTTSIRRAACITGATGLLALSMAGPASARQDPGTGSLAEQHCTTDCYMGQNGDRADTTGPTYRPTDDNAIEVLQLGAGLLAGAALAGAGVAVVSRRTHTRAAHPA